MIERIVQTVTDDDDIVEQEFEIKLRPHDFASYTGQERLKKNLQLAITAAKKRGEPLITCCYTALRDSAKQRWRA